ncbi:hypothetical protein D9M68_903160 [compost metagenome]
MELIFIADLAPGNVPEELRQGKENTSGLAMILASSFCSDLDFSAYKLGTSDKFIVQIIVNGLPKRSRL